METGEWNALHEVIAAKVGHVTQNVTQGQPIGAEMLHSLPTKGMPHP
jgi:hypothetical protein